MAVSFPIRLQKWVTSKSLLGDNAEAITKNISMFAEITNDGGSRSFEFGDTKMVKSKRFRVRFNTNFDPTGNWRIIYNGHSYTVTSIEQDKEKRFWWTFNATAE